MTEFVHLAPAYAGKLVACTVAYTAAALALVTLTSQRTTIAFRHRVLRVVVLGALLLPLAPLLLPSGGAATQSDAGPAITLSVTPLAAGAAVWLVGSLLQLAIIAAGALKLRAVRRSATRASTAHHRLFEACRQRMDLGSRVRMIFAPVASPFVAGIFRPVVFLPGDAAAWDANLLRSALTHELAHLARRDLVWGAATAAVTTLFWWNPAAWWLARRLVQQRESLCDQLAAERSGLGTRTYAHSLIEICSLTSAHHSTAIAAAIRHGSLEERIRYLCPDRHLHHSPDSPLSKATVILASAALALFAVIACQVAVSLRAASPDWSETELSARWAADPFPASR